MKNIISLLLLTFSYSIFCNEIPTPKEYALTTADSSSFKIYVFEPKDNNRSGSAIITVHGGGWKWGKAEWTFRASKMFADAGMLAVAVDYRLSNDTITPVDAKRDVCMALNWVREKSEKYQIDPDKVAAYGVSAGGHLSSIAATKGCGNKLGSKKNGGPDLLLLWSPALDMENDGWFKKLLLGKHPVAESSPLATVNKNMPPVSIIQGELDTLTPLTGASSFCKKVESNNGVCELHTYPKVGHLLTRNLENQENNFDPDPVHVKDGNDKLLKFLIKNQYVKPQSDKSIN
ncbi:MAG: alpha/beta hydrolase [Gammaproteobacteria bacterium]|nr:alpha/beta hydrolase [Gammaproteobacteria bacterium]